MKKVMAIAFLFFSIQLLVSDTLIEGFFRTRSGVKAIACKALVGQIRRDTMDRGAMITSLSSKPLTEEMLSDYVAISNALERQNREYSDVCTTALAHGSN